MIGLLERTMKHRLVEQAVGIPVKSGAPAVDVTAAKMAWAVRTSELIDNDRSASVGQADRNLVLPIPFGFQLDRRCLATAWELVPENWFRKGKKSVTGRPLQPPRNQPGRDERRLI
jgi:hypothetical protein